jgi:predicted HTH transcriptional regulator
VPETTHDDVPHVPSATVAPTYTQNDRARAIDVRRKKKEGKLQKILEYVREHGSIVNDEIQEVADCADNTALLYAKALVKRGELVAKGKGVGTRYVLPVNMSAL